MILICNNDSCNREYNANRSTRKFCSADCALIYRVTSSKITQRCENSNCNKEFISNLSEKRKYCSSSCAAIVNNRLVPKRFPEKVCNCGKKININSKNCKECTKKINFDLAIASWLSGESLGGSARKLSLPIRRYLLEKSKYSCSKCGFNTPHPSDGKTILEIDHIDGDGSNHRPENLQVLCPNCHALTPTYRARNKWNGRKVYYLRVDKR